MKHLLEAALFLFAYTVFRLLPLDAASGLGGWLGRKLGPRSRKLTHIANTNLSLAFPEKTSEEKERILKGMWENLGRVAAEFAHLPSDELLGRVTCISLENLPVADQPAIFVSGHYGNWELTYPIAHAHGVPMTLVYRHANNPYIDRLISRIRRYHADDMFPKGMQGAVRLAKALKRRMSLAMLIDQKMNEGIAVPFFGHEVMAPVAAAQFALRFDLPIIPARVVRTQGAHFKAFVYPSLAYAKTGDETHDVQTILRALHALLEEWIREHPEQWFWIHRRWPKEMYKKEEAAPAAAS